MKRLLIISLLSPVMLSAQPEQPVNGGNDDAARSNLQAMASSMSNDRCTRAGDIHISDNGEHTTTVIFHHDITALEPVIMRQPPLYIGPVGLAAPILMKNEPPSPGRLTPKDEPVIDIHMELDVAMVPIASTEPVLLRKEKATFSPLALLKEPAIDIYFEQEVALVPVAISGHISLIKHKPLSKPLILIKEPETHADAALLERMPVEIMHLSSNGYSLLQKMEGYSPSLYSLHDGGFTIGFGFFVPYSEGHKWTKGLSWAEAENMMHQKVPAYEDQVKQYINVPLTQNEFDALTMLAYNLGGFSKATSIINDINGQVGHEKIQSDWKKFVHSKAPNVAKGLMIRRSDELKVRTKSDYQPERKIQIFKSRK